MWRGAFSSVSRSWLCCVFLRTFFWCFLQSKMTRNPWFKSRQMLRFTQLPFAKGSRAGRLGNKVKPKTYKISVTPVVPSFEWLSVFTKPLHIKMKTCQCFSSFWGEILPSFAGLHGVFVHICFTFYISLDRNKTFHEKCILTTSAGPG